MLCNSSHFKCFLRNFIQSASFSRIIYIPLKGHDHGALVSLFRKEKSDAKIYSAILYFTKGATYYVFIVVLHALRSARPRDWIPNALFVALHFAAESDMMRAGIYIRRVITAVKILSKLQ